MYVFSKHWEVHTLHSTKKENYTRILSPVVYCGLSDVVYGVVHVVVSLEV